MLRCSVEALRLINPIALKVAQILWSSGRFECNIAFWPLLLQ